MDREDDSTLIAVVSAVFVAAAQAHFDQKVFVVAVFGGIFSEGRAAVGAVAELELADDGVAEAAFAEVGQTYGLSLLGSHHGLGEVILSEAVDVEHTLALVLGCQFLGSLLAFLYLDAVFLGKIT